MKKDESLDVRQLGASIIYKKLPVLPPFIVWCLSTSSDAVSKLEHRQETAFQREDLTLEEQTESAAAKTWT